ncbi:hypothetical protein EPA93_41660 [Ktedonosporobacter rubrisoli]|uniref:DUF6788 domain-containing protein n=1 Tax=Ktedonosporobacter rubrisoli TaxID=2509675 RepID=A0A4P6K2P9_KTERU|nr:DUF6788 family protein [Ktedonosporobacter rubrisoli]QBD82143.1 hypothetical protein EPA93_41660 [Ktedonosporobacter rubrisoli]
MADIPNDQHITYQLQYRKCGKASCSTCRNGQGHGPYWYAYWREGSRLRSGYVGKVHPSLRGAASALQESVKKPVKVLTEDYSATPAFI